MAYTNARANTAPLSALFSSQKVYRALVILLALSLSFYALSSFSKIQEGGPDWQRHKGNKSESKAPIDKDRRFAIVIPSTKPSPNLCKTMFSGLILGYPSPVIINWGVNYVDISHWKWGRNLPKIIGFVDYLDSVMHPNATRSEKLEEDDIVLMIDGFDIWFQLPPQVLLSRYHEINRRANERLRQQWSKNKGPMPMKQTIIAATQKRCRPDDPEYYGVDQRCDSWPESPLRADLYGPETEKNTSYWHNNRPRWINGGIYIGPAGDMRRMFRRAKQRTEELVGEAFPIRSEQGMLGEIVGEQEVWRQWQRNNYVNVELDDLVGKKLEFHAGVDYAQELSVQVQYGDINSKEGLFDGDFISLGDEESIAQHSALRGISPPRLNGLPDDIKSAQNPLMEFDKTANWSNMPLYTDFFLPSVPVMLHHNGFKGRRVTWWDRPWYYHRLRELLKPALLAREPDNPVATIQLEQGRIRYWASSAETTDRYPRMGKLNANLTAYERFPKVQFNETCGYAEGKVIHGHDDKWWEEVFRDGAGEFI